MAMRARNRFSMSSWLRFNACVFLLTSAPLVTLRVVAVASSQTTPRGNPAKGRALFEASKCFDCHRIGENGSRLGPDLSDIGTLRSLDVLQLAIVAPDDEVLPEHRSVRLVTKDGTAVVGKLLNQDAFSIQLMNAEEQLKSYLKSNLREYAIAEKGIMPSYAGKLTAQQVADIVSYLESLKGEQK